jgi:regulator of RNase E activity RraB
MGFLDNIFGKKEVGQFRSVEQQTANREKQLEMTPQTLDVLRQHGVADDSLLRLEFFFYTNTSEKAAELSDNLTSLGYSSSFGTSASNAKEFLVNGWSTPIKMDRCSALEWSALMCELAERYDCEFDGWGTDPTQALSDDDNES